MNSITIAGNLGRDAELRHTQGGDAVLSFSVADNQGRDKETLWWRCNLWGKRAAVLAQYLTKGQQVTVVGNVSEREWTDREGQARKSMEVRVTEIALQGGRREESAPSQQPPRPAAAQRGDVDDDIPF